MIGTAKAKEETAPVWSDERLVQQCLRGNQEAWSALIDKYRKLIYSIPVKWQLPREDANDIFQSVCIDLYAELSRLREPRALPKWLIQTTVHKCARCRQQQSRTSDQEISEDLALTTVTAATLIEEVEREQMLRDAIVAVGGRCAEMIHMLFFASPALAYEQIARKLGLATGSIGFIRGRCLDRLKKQLLSRGWR